MNSIYQDALNGTLAGSVGASLGNVTFTNNTEIPVQLDTISTAGTHISVGTILPGASATAGPLYVGGYNLITSLKTGAFMTVITMVANTTSYSITCGMLCNPNDIGAVPQPNVMVVIPPDSPRVLVACAKLANGNYLTREQYWSLQPDSYCLGPNEQKTVSLTSTSGKQHTSSSETSIATSLGVSASGGWGPISASLSASLSTNSSTFQQVTVTEQVTSYISDTLHNTTATSSLFLRWQLIDVITVLDAQGNPIASIVSGQNPVLVMGPYNLMQLPAPPSLQNASSAIGAKEVLTMETPVNTN